MTDEIDVERLAVAYRRLVLWFGAQLIWSVVQFVPVFIPYDSLRVGLGLLLSIGGILVIMGALAYYGAETAAALGSKVGWLWGLGMLLFCVNVITLLVLSSKATRTCKANGISVGLFGPKLKADGTFERIAVPQDHLETYEPEWRKIGRTE